MLIALLKDAEVWQDQYQETMTQIEEKCEFCKIYAKTPSRLIGVVLMASKCNEKVAMVHKQWNNGWLLNIIDMWSKYTSSMFIDWKKPSHVIDTQMAHSIGKFGVMSARMTDNGGEFSSDEMRKTTSILKIQLCTTAGEVIEKQ